jgi:CheY-like chemotaxis protein
MPNMNGMEVLKAMQADEALKNVPVIVLTVDHDAELECLKLGAMDFIPKPYPDIEIVKARIEKCIELSKKGL